MEQGDGKHPAVERGVGQRLAQRAFGEMPANLRAEGGFQGPAGEHLLIAPDGVGGEPAPVAGDRRSG